MKKNHLILSAAIILGSGLLVLSFMPKEDNSTSPLASNVASTVTTTEEIRTETINKEQQQNIIKETSVSSTPKKTTKNTTETLKENTRQAPSELVEKELPLPPTMEENQLSEIGDLWETLDQDMVFEDFPPAKDLESVQAIRLSAMDMIGTLKEGDTVSLPLIEGEEYTATITETENFENGSSSMTGKYEANGESYTVTLTQGVKTSFGTFTTPNGTYQISLVGGKGYLYSSDELDEKRIDTKQPDFLLPETPETES